jgi:hypothetical protein
MTVDLFGLDAAPARSMGSHQSAVGGGDEWLTPPWLIEALGPFDLDPCSPIERPWPTAAKHYTIEDDGLAQPWNGRVWLNPPYAHAGKWLHRLAEHGDGLACIFARTETALWFTHVWPRASALLFLKGRLTFHYRSGRRADANSGAPSVLVAYGSDEAARLGQADIPGQFMALQEAK